MTTSYFNTEQNGEGKKFKKEKMHSVSRLLTCTAPFITSQIFVTAFTSFLLLNCNSSVKKTEVTNETPH